jgi:hypothetical protein
MGSASLDAHKGDQGSWPQNSGASATVPAASGLDPYIRILPLTAVIINMKAKG